MTEKEQFYFKELVEKSNELVVENSLQKIQLYELKSELLAVYREMADLNYDRSIIPMEVETNTLHVVGGKRAAKKRKDK
jgi:hypothetical protein